MKTNNLIINWVPLSPTSILCLKDYQNLTKYEIKVTSNFEALPRLILKKINFKIKAQVQQLSKIPKCLCELGNTWKYRLTNPNPNFELVREPATEVFTPFLTKGLTT